MPPSLCVFFQLSLNHWTFVLSLPLYPLIISMSPTYLSSAPSVGYDPSQGFFLKENISLGSKWDFKDDNFQKVKGISKMAFSHFKQGRLEPINFDLIQCNDWTCKNHDSRVHNYRIHYMSLCILLKLSYMICGSVSGGMSSKLFSHLISFSSIKSFL